MKRSRLAQLPAYFRSAALVLACVFSCFGMETTLAFQDTREPQTIAIAQLPAEARTTLQLIRNGGPFPYRRDGIEFQNRERRLPARSRGYYREYTVPTPGAYDRGARRIISGAANEYYYSDDHYRHFRRITP